MRLAFNSSVSCLHLLSAWLIGAYHLVLIFLNYHCIHLFILQFLSHLTVPFFFFLSFSFFLSLWLFGSHWRHFLILIFEWEVSIFQQCNCIQSSQWLCNLRRAKLHLHCEGEVEAQSKFQLSIVMWHWLSFTVPCLVKTPHYHTDTLWIPLSLFFLWRKKNEWFSNDDSVHTKLDLVNSDLFHLFQSYFLSIGLWELM